jgi:hypothetical protein
LIVNHPATETLRRCQLPAHFRKQAISVILLKINAHPFPGLWNFSRSAKISSLRAGNFRTLTLKIGQFPHIADLYPQAQKMLPQISEVFHSVLCCQFTNLEQRGLF